MVRQLSILGPLLVLMMSSAVAQEQPLARLAKLVSAKGYSNVPVGTLCAQFSIPVDPCVARQINDDEAKPLPSFNVMRDSSGKDRIIIAIHDGKSGFAYLTSVSGQLEAVLKGTKTNIWHWESTSIMDEMRTDYRKQYDYWKSNEDLIATFPDRP